LSLAGGCHPRLAGAEAGIRPRVDASIAPTSSMN